MIGFLTQKNLFSLLSNLQPDSGFWVFSFFLFLDFIFDPMRFETFCTMGSESAPPMKISFGEFAELMEVNAQVCFDAVRGSKKNDSSQEQHKKDHIWHGDHNPHGLPKSLHYLP